MDRLRAFVLVVWSAVAAFVSKHRAHVATGVVAIATSGVVMRSFLPPPTTPGPIYINPNGAMSSNAGAFDKEDVGKEPVGLCVVVDAGTGAIIYPEVPQFAPGETCDYDILIDFTPPGVTTAGATGKIKREILGVMLNGACTTPDGGTFDHGVYSDLGASISDASALIAQQDAGFIGVQVWTPLTECIGASASAVRRLPSWQGTDAGAIVDGATPAVLQVYPLAIASEAGATQLTIFTTHGDMQGATGATVAGQTLTSFSALDQHTATGILPAGYYDAGTYNVAISGATSSPIACPGCLTAGVSAGPLPTVSSIVPNAGTAAGGWNVTVTGTNLTGASMTLNGNPLTSVSCSSTVCTGLTPAYSPTTGSGATGYGIVITTGAGSVTGSTIPTKYWYLSSTNTYVGMWQADTIATANAASWVDQNGAQNWTQATGANQPAVSTGFNGGSLKYITCSGSPVNMTNTFATPIANGQITGAVVMNYTAVASATNAMFQITGTTFNFANYASTTTLFGSDTISGSVTFATGVTTAAHVLTATVGAASAGNVWFDGTNTSGTIHNATNLGGGANTLCNSVQVAGYATANIAFLAFWSQALPGTDLTNLRASLKAIYGTP
jgi:hypothetical protein